MKRSLILIISSLAFSVGCGKSDPIAKMQGYVDSMCKCDNKECAEGVDKDMKEWAMKNIDSLKDMEKTASDDDKKKAKELDSKFRECKRNAKKGGGDGDKKADGDKKPEGDKKADGDKKEGGGW